jgi:hypothetical protein
MLKNTDPDVKTWFVTCKVTHDAGQLIPFPSASVTRQGTGTLCTPLNTPLPGCIADFFLYVVFGFQLLGKVWFVFIVVTLDVLGSLRRSFSTILVAPPYLFLCIFASLFPFGDLPKRHMWGVFHISYIGFSWLHIVLAWHFMLFIMNR